MDREDRCWGQILLSFVNLRLGFTLNKLQEAPSRGDISHTLPTLASVLTLVRTLSPRSHNLQTCASSQYGPLVHSFTWSLKL